MEGIKRVEVAKRALKFVFFHKVELRLGNVDESDKGAAQLSANPKVGYFGTPESNQQMAVFDLTENPASGKFLTLQQAGGTFSVDELYISF